MKESEIREVCERCIKEYGLPAQVEQLDEEMHELGLALHHYRKGKVHEDAVVTEIADLIIMLRQMAYFFGYEEVDAEIANKNKRQEERLAKAHNAKTKEYYGC